MKKFVELFVAPLAVAVIGGVILLVIQTSKEPLLQYKNPDLKVEIKYPQSWSKQTQNGFGEVARFFPKVEKPTNNCPVEITINVDSLKQVQSLDEYKEDTAKKKIVGNNPNSQVTDNSKANTTLSSFKAYKLVYQRQDGQCNLKVMEIGTLRNNRAYYITYAAEVGVYDKFLPKVEEMVTSFDIN